ncbi:unnamed protein product [Adineta ricciae]|uniref:Uncharacterized protein n=1 Tax=Adineta ricciae TaxID=249248 RepID=A0A814ME84_ADIRI|nr:unnamed protein product [Adineta ricciae]
MTHRRAALLQLVIHLPSIPMLCNIDPTLYLRIKHLQHSLQNTLQSTLTTLILAGNRIGSQGVEYIANALIHNTTLIELDISNNRIFASGAEHLANALRRNQTLSVLKTNHNEINDSDIEYLVKALNENHFVIDIFHLIRRHILTDSSLYKLITFVLSQNSIEDEGAQHFANALKSNQTLTSLSISRNLVSSQGANYLLDVLKENQTFTYLNLTNNHIGEEALEEFEINVQERTTPITIKLARKLYLTLEIKLNDQ